MKFNHNKLRGRIVEKYGVMNKFAEAFGKCPTIVSRKLVGTSKFTDVEIMKVCKLLDIPTDEIVEYFFNVED